MSDKLREAAEGMVTLADMDRIPAPNACVWFNAFDRRIAALRAALADSATRTVDDVYHDVRHEPRPDSPPEPTDEMEALARKAEKTFECFGGPLSGQWKRADEVPWGGHYEQDTVPLGDDDIQTLVWWWTEETREAVCAKCGGLLPPSLNLMEGL